MMQNKWRAVEETEENWGNSKDARQLWWNYGRLETQKEQGKGLLQNNVDSHWGMSITEKQRAVRKPSWWLMGSQASLASWTHTLGPRSGLKSSNICGYSQNIGDWVRKKGSDPHGYKQQWPMRHGKQASTINQAIRTSHFPYNRLHQTNTAASQYCLRQKKSTNQCPKWLDLRQVSFWL